jgi:hypothetical protein
MSVNTDNETSRRETVTYDDAEGMQTHLYNVASDLDPRLTVAGLEHLAVCSLDVHLCDYVVAEMLCSLAVRSFHYYFKGVGASTDDAMLVLRAIKSLDEPYWIKVFACH